MAELYSYLVRRYSKLGNRITATNAVHFDGVGPQSYDTEYDVIIYDSNMHIILLVFAEYIRTEN